MADLTPKEKACAFFDDCHRNAASDRDVWYNMGILLCHILTDLQINVDNLEITALTDAELRATPVPVVGPTTQLTPSITTDSTAHSTTVVAGARRVEFLLSDDFTGTIDGEAFVGGAGKDYSVGPFVAPGEHTLAAIPYTITTGSVRILKVV